MAHSAVDLPDPLQKSASTMSGTDDLLSQLAGDEIDRLLAEDENSEGADDAPADEIASVANDVSSAAITDTLKPAAPAAENAVGRDTASAEAVDDEQDSLSESNIAAEMVADAGANALAAESAVSGQLDALFQELDQPATPAAAAPSTPSATPATQVTEVESPTVQSLESAFAAELPVSPKDLDAAIAAEAPSLLPKSDDPPAPPTPAAVATAPAPVDLHDTATSATERSALAEADKALNKTMAVLDKTPVAEDTTRHAVHGAEETDNAADENRPLPFLLRPLEWLNAPLASCSEEVREGLGKIAIITAMNALAVLVYLFFFRHR